MAKLMFNVEYVAPSTEFGTEGGYLCHLRGAAYYDAPAHNAAKTPEMALALSMSVCAHQLSRNRVTEIEKHEFTNDFWNSKTLNVMQCTRGGDVVSQGMPAASNLIY